MFPNFRLMLAATAASIVALSCGFAVFAAFRVNHEPLTRLPSANAPLQLAAHAPLTVAIPSVEPVDRRPEVSEPSPESDTADTAVPKLDEGSVKPPAATVAVEAEPAAATAEPEPAPPATEEPGSKLEIAMISPPKPSAQAVGETTKVDEPKADMPADSSSQSQHELVKPAEGGGTIASPREANVAEAEPQPKSEEAAEATGSVGATAEAPPAPLPAVAAVAPTGDEAPAPERSEQGVEVAPASAPDSAAEAMAENDQKAVAKTAARKRTARTRRAHRIRGGAVAHYGTGSFAFDQPHFLTAPQETMQPLPARRRRAGAASQNSAMGGPFVGARGP